MGAITSRGNPSVEVPPSLNRMCVSLTKPDKIHVIYGGDDEHTAVRAAILETWTEGIMHEKPIKHHAYTRRYTMKGLPFGSADLGINYSVSTEIQTITQIIMKLHNVGWELAETTELSRQMQFSHLFFSKQENQHGNLVSLPCVSLSSIDKMTLVNIPAEFYPRIREHIASYWEKGIQSENHGDNSLEIQLNGKPWYGKVLSMPARLLMTQLFQLFHRKYCMEFLSRVNLRSKGDTFFFRPKTQEAITSEEHTFMGICLYGKNGVLLIDTPAILVPEIRQVLQETWGWKGGIKEEKEYVSCFGFTLMGSPWWSHGDKQTAISRLVICRLLEALKLHGWCIVTGTAFAKHSLNKDMLLFHKTHPEQSSVMCLSPNKSNKLRLVNTPEDVTSTVRELLQMHWPRRIKSEKRNKTPFAFLEFRLAGKPWGGKSNDSHATASLMCYVLQALEQKGWKLILSADISAKYMFPGEDEYDEDDINSPGDTHSLWFANQSSSAFTSGIQNVQVPDNDDEDTLPTTFLESEYSAVA